MSAKWNTTRSGWFLASLLIHATILAAMMLVSGGNTRGLGTFGTVQEGAFSVTWIPGDGSRGNVDTVLPGDETGNFVEEFDSATAAVSENMTPANFPIAVTDPTNVFNPESVERFGVEVKNDAKPPNEPAVANEAHDLRQEIDHPPQTSVENELASMSKFNRPPVSQATSATESNEKPIRPTAEPGTSGKSNRGNGTGDSGASGEGGQSVQFFGIFARGKRIVYVIDASESMRKHRAIDIVREELSQSLKGLEPASSFQIVFFDVKPYTMNRPDERGKLLRATSSNLRQAELFIKGIQPDAGTDRFLALTEALSFDPDLIFLLTDADEPVMTAEELWKIQRGNKSKRKAAIHVVEFGIGGDLSRDSFLKKLARQNQGTHRYRELARIEP